MAESETLLVPSHIQNLTGAWCIHNALHRDTYCVAKNYISDLRFESRKHSARTGSSSNCSRFAATVPARRRLLRSRAIARKFHDQLHSYDIWKRYGRSLDLHLIIQNPSLSFEKWKRPKQKGSRLILE